MVSAILMVEWQLLHVNVTFWLSLSVLPLSLALLEFLLALGTGCTRHISLSLSAHATYETPLILTSSAFRTCRFHPDVLLLGGVVAPVEDSPM